MWLICHFVNHLKSNNLFVENEASSRRYVSSTYLKRIYSKRVPDMLSTRRRHHLAISSNCKDEFLLLAAVRLI